MPPAAEVRPSITSVRTGAELRRWYWLHAELLALARTRGVRTGGGKQVLTSRLAEALDSATGEGRPAFPAARQPSGAQLAGELSSDTVIPPGQRCSQALRGFFAGAVGPGFRFDEAMREFIAVGAGQTLGDAVEHWHATRHRPPGEIAPQFEHNRFQRAWHQDHPDGSRVAARAAWQAYRALPIERRP